MFRCCRAGILRSVPANEGWEDMIVSDIGCLVQSACGANASGCHPGRLWLSYPHPTIVQMQVR
eukprot:752050-Hanusia_phi.AAC.1